MRLNYPETDGPNGRVETQAEYLGQETTRSERFLDWLHRLDDNAPNRAYLIAQATFLLVGGVVLPLAGMDRAPWWLLLAPTLAVAALVVVTYAVVGCFVLAEDRHERIGDASLG
jgi:fatty acid desaturase